MNLPNPFPGYGQVNLTTTTTVTTSTPKYKFKKAGNNGNIIAVVLDESGSMNVCRNETIVGFNEFVQGQKAADAGDAFLTLVKFNAPHIKTVFADRPLNEVPKLDHSNYSPSGGTNLLDAIGHTIETVNEALEQRKKKDRPGVIVLIMTDGEENSSRKYNNEQIKAMVKAAEKADWSFVFLGANIDAFSVGATFGMNHLNSVNYSTANMSATMSATSILTANMRSAKLAGLNTHAVYASTTMSDKDRERIK